MLNLTIRIAQRRIGTLLARRPVQQRRSIAELPGKDHESSLANAALRWRYAMNTMFGIMAASSVVIAAKVARLTSDPNTAWVLVHDSSKGELDDVKYIKASEMPKKT